MEGQRSAARGVWRGVVIAGFAVIAALNLPGHLPFDSVTGLWEGRTHVRMSWGPRMYSAILGFFDSLVPGTSLFAMASIMVTALSWAALPRLRSRVVWTGPLLLALAFALPQVLIYQGIILRDVLFGDLTVAAFVLLAAAARSWSKPRLRWGLLILAVAALAFGALVRQNGGVVIAAWALALGWIAARKNWRRGFAWGAAGLVAPICLAVALNIVNPVHEPAGGRPHATGLRLLAHYDLMAALAENPNYPLRRLAAERPLNLDVMRRAAPRGYSPHRVDFQERSEILGPALWRMPAPLVAAQWRDMIVTDPVGYARRRLEVFRWVFLTPDLPACVPVLLGVDGLPDIEKQLGLVHGHWQQDTWLWDYANWWYPTPFYSHLTYALAAAAVAAFLLLRRDPQDIAMAALMVGTLGFTATFLVVSIACDYRYLYALDLAAITGVLYVAVDPALRRRPPGPPEPPRRAS
jgi:hypothetical protein